MLRATKRLDSISKLLKGEATHDTAIIQVLNNDESVTDVVALIGMSSGCVNDTRE